MTYENALKDTLHNLSLDENGNFNVSQDQKMYYQGLIAGILAALMYKGLTFENAKMKIEYNLPDNPIDFKSFMKTIW